MTDNYARRFDLGGESFRGWTICICLLCGGRKSISINIVMWECSDFMAYAAPVDVCVSFFCFVFFRDMPKLAYSHGVLGQFLK